MNKQEMIDKYEYMNSNLETWVDTSKVLKDLKQLDEPQKVTIPQFAADWIEVCKEHLPISLYTAMNPNFMKQNNQSSDLMLWIEKSSNQEIFAQAWIFGYTVEEKKQYEVILCNGQSLKTVYRQGEDRLDFEKVYGDLERFTRKQLEQAGFGWVFDCLGIEIKEVE